MFKSRKRLFGLREFRTSLMIYGAIQVLLIMTFLIRELACSTEYVLFAMLCSSGGALFNVMNFNQAMKNERLNEKQEEIREYRKKFAGE